MKKMAMVLGLLLALLLGASAVGQDSAGFKDLQSKVTYFTLDNGLRVIVLERHEAPVIAFQTYVEIGSVNEWEGVTGIAHMFEHMAFKGTETIGTTDWPAERAALRAMDEAYEAYRAEKHKGLNCDPIRLEELFKAFKDAEKAADGFVKQNDYDAIMSRVGSSGLNAYTSSENTGYICQLPSNKLEFWFALEAERFVKPVMREFYKERDVVANERRWRTEDQAVGLLIEEILGAAFKAHPYGRNVIGHMSDINSYTRLEALDFYRKFYTPDKIILSMVGDVDPAEARRLAEKYFTMFPKGTPGEPVETVEPDQSGQKRVEVEYDAQPIVGISFHAPAMFHPDYPVFQILEQILSGGRTARLYKSLVEGSKMALQTGAWGGFPGQKYPALFTVYAVNNADVKSEDLEKALWAEIDRLCNEPVGADELSRAQTNLNAGFVRSLRSNAGMAGRLAEYESVFGDWKELFNEVDRINAVTREDIQRVAKKYLVRRNSTVGTIVPKSAE